MNELYYEGSSGPETWGREPILINILFEVYLKASLAGIQAVAESARERIPGLCSRETEAGKAERHAVGEFRRNFAKSSIIGKRAQRPIRTNLDKFSQVPRSSANAERQSGSRKEMFCISLILSSCR